MIKSFNNFIDFIGSKKIILIVSCLTIVHLSWTLDLFFTNYFSQRQDLLQTRINRVIHMVNLIKDSPPLQRQKILLDAAPHSIFETFSLNTDPKWPQQFSIYDDLSLSLKTFTQLSTISVQIQPGQWLNMYFKPALYKKWIWFNLLTVLEITFLCCLLLFFLIIHRFNQSLINFKQAAQSLGIDLKITPLSVEGPAILREAADAVNEMQQRITNLVQSRTRMLAAISHDLRTPIMRMFLRTQLLLDNNLRESFHADLEEMQSMVKETLDFAKSDFNAEKKTYFDLVSLLEVICNEFAEIGHQVTFKTKLTKAPLAGHRLALKRAFNNLIDNAIHYGQKADVYLFMNKKRITIVIQDNGPGIKDSELERVFLPFYRGKEFSSETGLPGTGLGLAIAYDIIHNHRGKIYLKNTKNGLMARIKFSLN